MVIYNDIFYVALVKYGDPIMTLIMRHKLGLCRRNAFFLRKDEKPEHIAIINVFMYEKFSFKIVLKY